MPGIVTRASLESHASKIGAGPDGMGYVWALLIGILQMLLELFANGVFLQKQLERSAWIQRIIGGNLTISTVCHGKRFIYRWFTLQLT